MRSPQESGLNAIDPSGTDDRSIMSTPKPHAPNTTDPETVKPETADPETVDPETGTEPDGSPVENPSG